MDILQSILTKFKRLILAAGRRGLLNWLPDEPYLKLMFRLHMGRKLDLREPRAFNEKLQWLKLYDRKPEYTQMVDKYEAKKYAASVIGEEHVIPTLGVWERFDDIDFDALPNQFVLKCTHDSGGLVICRDKASFDKNAARTKINRAMRKNYYYHGREWPYKNVKPRIIAETYLENGSRGLVDYKFYCFDGIDRYLYVSEGLEDHSTANISFLTMDWQFAPFNRLDYKPFSALPPCPEHYEEMRQLARKLSANHPFLRVDLYDVGGTVYFSELTFSPVSGYMPFSPQEYDEILGRYISLPNGNH